MSKKTKVNRVSFSLEDEYIALFKKITDITRRKMTAELRLMIDERAVELGLDPIQPVAVPKK